MPIQHAAVGGSAIARILRCPGSVRLCAGLPRTTSAAADRGTMLHHMVAAVIERDIEPREMIGWRFGEQVLDEHDARTLLVTARAMVRRFLGEAKKPKLEVRVRFEKNVWGTADLLAHFNHVGYIADFKFGSHPVPAKDSEQLKFYAAAALEGGHFGKNPVEVRAAIIQPAVSNKVDATAYTPRELVEFAKLVRSVAKVALSPNAPVIAGEVQCQWCPARNVCPARDNLGQALAAFKSAGLTAST